ncbi:S49 family peptidase [candidate division KSB1 bacterium]|nr:S49 family peptidase [candidate division KSB1 bacterium]
MRRFNFLILTATIFLNNNILAGQSLPGYYQRNSFLLTSPGSFGYGLLGFTNPANLAIIPRFESRFDWSTDGTNLSSFKDWGLFLAAKNIGFAAVKQEFGQQSITDFKVSIAEGNQRAAFGLSYGWSNSSSSIRRDKLITTGWLFRPNKYLSMGFVGNFSLQSKDKEGIVDIGLRPFGSSFLTIFSDAALQKGQKIKDLKYSTGAALAISKGMFLVGRYFDNKSFSLGFSVNFGRAGMASQSRYDTNQNFNSNTYSIRSGGMLPSLFPILMDKNRKYMSFNMKGRIAYHKYQLFDQNTLPLFSLLKDIEASKNDPRVNVIALSLSGMRILPEHAWEIREALKSAQKSDKRVIVFIDNAGMSSYHLASIADQVVMDPEGSLLLPGFSMSRTFLKGTLEKLGLAFDEWRFFEYKSAVEILSREQMSDADRRQRQDYIDDWYELVRSDVSRSRNISGGQFDTLVNEKVYLTADMAKEAGLVDRVGRWSELEELIEEMHGSKLGRLQRRDLFTNSLQTEQWGELPKIAIVYGLGECAMDSGIRARWLDKVFRRLAIHKDIKAVVFRVDSPGGDGMASDVVAEALREFSKSKPVIVSQGQVAGSGGYWISMYGDMILAAPNTVTGSIGVIGGWLYDAGFSKKIGMTADIVKRGEHADLWRGIDLPYFGTVPVRNLDPEERKVMESIMKGLYQRFVTKVADGRGMSVDEVKKIAEGHFYSGLDGKEIGLVDEIGGLLAAIEIAKQKAGLTEEDEYEIVEIPKYKGLIDLGLPSLPYAIEAEMDPVITFIKLLNKHRGKPLVIMEPGSYPVVE